MIPIFLILWWTNFYFTAAVVFFLASITDFLDGHLARKRKQVTKLGALLDPLVDKILVTTGFIMLVEMNIIPGWAVVLMLAREFLVTGLRNILIEKGVILSAGFLGKLKTLLQTTAIITLYFALSMRQHQISFYPILITLGNTVFWISFLTTFASGIQYAIKGNKLIRKAADELAVKMSADKLTSTCSKPVVDFHN